MADIVEIPIENIEEVDEGFGEYEEEEWSSPWKAIAITGVQAFVPLATYLNFRGHSNAYTSVGLAFQAAEDTDYWA